MKVRFQTKVKVIEVAEVWAKEWTPSLKEAFTYDNPSCDLLDIHELLRSHEGWQASAPTEEEAHGRENYNDILSM